MTDGSHSSEPGTVPAAGRRAGGHAGRVPHADRMSAESSSVRFSSTVLAPAQIALGVVGGLVVAFVLVELGLWPVAIAALIVATGLGYYLAPLTITIGGRHLAISQGRGDKNERVVNTDDITAVEARTLTWQQCLGIGIESDDLTTRMTVRPGPALFVSLISGEQLRLSAENPEAAVAALGRAVPLVPVTPDVAVAPDLAVAPPTSAPPTSAPPTSAPVPLVPPPVTPAPPAAPVVPEAPDTPADTGADAGPTARPRPRPRPNL